MILVIFCSPVIVAFGKAKNQAAERLILALRFICLCSVLIRVSMRSFTNKLDRGDGTGQMSPMNMA